MAFADALPGIRRRVDADMKRPGLSRDKVLATVVHLLETTLIRVGNDDYARTNKSYGLTTLRDPHVRIEGSALSFRFKGKSGKTWDVSLKDRRVARIVKACQDLPGQELFQYLDPDGTQRDVTSSDVNAYLREITGEDFTAKDFRTWAGTVLAALALREFETFDSEAGAKRNIRAAIENVAGRLGNTPTICRKCYIHPQILDCYLEGGLLLQVKDAVESELSEDLSSLRPEEAAVLGLLQARLSAAEDAVKAKGRVKPAGARGRGAKAPERSKSGTAAAKRASGARKAAAAAWGRSPRDRPIPLSVPGLVVVARGAAVGAAPDLVAGVDHGGQAQLAGQRDQVLQPAGLGLAPQVKPVGLHRAHAERQPPRDLLVAEPGAEEAQDLRLAGRQPEALARLRRHRHRLLRRDQDVGALREGEQCRAELARRLGARHEGVGARGQQGAEVVRREGTEGDQRAERRLTLLQGDDAGDPVGQPDLVEEDQGDAAAGVGAVEIGLADGVEFGHVLEGGANRRAQVLRLIQDQDANGRTHDLAPLSPGLIQAAGIEGEVPRSVPATAREY